MRLMPGPLPPPSVMRRLVPGAAHPRERDNRDVLLQNNPDFEIPGMRPPGGGGMATGGGMNGQPNGRMPMQRQRQRSPDFNLDINVPMNGLTGVGRYPPQP